MPLLRPLVPQPRPPLRAAYGIDPADYRATFELPATMALMATDLREQQALRGAALLATNTTVRQAFAVDDPDDPRRRLRQSRGLRRRAQTVSRAGVQRSKQAVGALLAEKSRAAAAERRAAHDQLAQHRGHPGFVALLTAHVHLTDVELGELLGWTTAKARWWRRHHGQPGQARTARARARADTARTGLDTVPAGTQPARDGRLRCLICGRWWQDLSQHLTGTHKLTSAQYRTTHGLPPGTVLQGATRQHGNQRLAALARDAGHRAGQLKSDRVRAEYDRRAQHLGYPDVSALLRARSNREVTDLLDLGRGAATKLRARYL